MNRRAGAWGGVVAVLLTGAGLLPAGGTVNGLGATPARAQEVADEPASITAALTGAQSVDTARISSTCLDLPREPAFVSAGHGERRSESHLTHRCEVAGAGLLGSAYGRSWRWAVYRHLFVYETRGDTERGAEAETRSDEDPAARVPAVQDTVREEEIVLLSAPSAEAPRARPVWHVRVDNLFWSLEPPPGLAVHDGAALLRVRHCLAGTGGCRDRTFRLERGGGATPLRPAYLEAVRARLPEGWGLWKGAFLEVDSLTARAPVYMPRDPNCCPSHRARLVLRLEGDALALEDVRIEPDTTNREAWHVGRDGVGPLGPGSGADELAAVYGPGQVRSGEVYLSEGVCAPGAVVFPDDPRELRVAWTDTTRSRPAFVRISHPESPWRTPEGVRVGTSLATLERIRGAPLTFRGFEWDHGGEMVWRPAPDPATRGEGEGGRGALPDGEIRLRMAPTPEGRRTLGERAGEDPRTEELFGDRRVSSDHPLLEGVDVEVREIVVAWARPEAQTECSGSVRPRPDARAAEGPGARTRRRGDRR